jgi:tripartite-type tricarboxylate transporter receptor subunit TctC
MLTADTATLAANPSLYAKLTYDVEKDFAPVGLMARFPMLLVVNASVPAKTLAEFTAWAKAAAGGINYATPGSGSPHHPCDRAVPRAQRPEADARAVPRRRAGGAGRDRRPGPVHVRRHRSAYPHIQSGKLRAIGVASPEAGGRLRHRCRRSPSRA